MKLLSLLAATALMVSVPAFANQDLAQKNGCLACHAVDKKVIGPSYKDVAKKYAGNKGAAAKLMEKVKKGGSGAWGTVAMPPNPQVKDADLNKIIAWILKQK